MASPYRNDYRLCALGVNNNTRAIFDLMRTRMDEMNLVHLSVDLKIKFMKKTTSKAAEPLDAFKTILQTLKNADVIRNKSDGAFMINPDYGMRYEGSGKQIREQWNNLNFKRREPQSLMKGTTVPHDREPQSLMKGTTVPHDREPQSLMKGTTVPPLKLIK
ncbi:replication/maintenance protein RepL [Leucothrix pacifica]|uniref:Plasmid replication protein RepL domain-containing protein n=1 Tax=Leucothrix pacifica TaxID=1247513 RepID=A0A317CN04_9GAMM|nr:replication/maintenance protein RepL [Leucothrix pacifica]PWQ97690.1 hypothetical protein DKW60_09950 [Leucothrix pacifica]